MTPMQSATVNVPPNNNQVGWRTEVLAADTLSMGQVEGQVSYMALPKVFYSVKDEEVRL